MNLLRIIPSLLLSNKKLVKGTMFKNHKSAGKRVTTTLAFENQWADEISIIDIDCYKKKDLEFIIKNYNIDIVNLPISVANQEFCKKN